LAGRGGGNGDGGRLGEEVVNVDAETVLKIASLALALIAGYVGWRVFRLNRSDLRITLEYHHIADRGASFLVIVTNHGRHPAYVQSVLIRLKGGDDLSPEESSGPIVLEEGCPHIFWFPLYDYTLHNPVKIRDLLKIKKVEIYDTFGKRYRFPSLSLNPLLTLKSQYAFFRLKQQLVREWATESED
jgi:hypothetical protein